MIGHTKYNLRNKVRFQFNGETKEGRVVVVDKYGTFMDKSDVSYDIMVKSENTLYKHINEKFIL